MVPSPILKFGSLESALARSQTQAVLAQIAEAAPRCTCHLELLASPETPPARNDENFLAASAAEMTWLGERVLDGTIDVFVAEAADLQAPLPEGLELLCVPDRTNPFDAFLNRQGLIMDEMAPGSRIGVLSLRSRTQMQALWPDLKFTVIRGGVDNAMAVHLRKSEIDGLVLPASVTENLGIQGIVAEIFSPEFLLPGFGQGMLVVIGRSDDGDARKLLEPLHSQATAVELKAEQAFYQRLVSDQDLPVGVLARVKGKAVSVLGATGTGSSRVQGDGRIEEAELVGQSLADHVLQSVDSFLDLLEADFPEGLPEDELDEDYDEDLDDDLTEDPEDDLDDDLKPDFD